MAISCLLRLLPALALTAAAPWPQAATQDLAALHDLIADNHPGPADPQNPGFRIWLNDGEATLLPQARAARTLHDYQLVLRTYANGFADGHLGVAFTDQPAHLWPGFLARADAPGAPLRVTAVNAAPDIQLGQVIKSCGGIPAAKLLADRIQKPTLNPHVPQRLRLASTALMVADADDPAALWPTCVLQDRTITLHWRPITPGQLAQARQQASGIDIPQAGLRRFGDVWLISMPSFYPQDPAALARLKTLVAQVKTHAAELHAARHVVLDLRGNDGGDDAWGFQVAEALWGSAAVQAVEAAMPSSIDWRVSARNEAAMRADVDMLRRQGQAEGAAYFSKLAGQMDRALARHEVFMHEPGDPPAPRPHLASPFAHPVYLLTTPHCASACLDFVDLMSGLPGVVRVGLETSSDTDYLEVAEATLPSGHARLHYAMKVYRQRQRGANVSYKPDTAWPGGNMNDASIVNWIDRLP